MRGILEAITFAKHVLGITGLDECINSRRCLGVANGKYTHAIKQSNPLSVVNLKVFHETLRKDPEPWNRAF